MSYTATFDASHKVKRSGAHATNFVRHIARDADQAAGFSFAQRNPNIDHSRTSMNLTMVNDAQGGWRVPMVMQDEMGKDRPPSAEFTDYLEARLSTVKKTIKSDAVAMRPLVLQLDPKWFEQHNPDWRDNGLNAEAEKYIGAELDWAADEFGHQNLIGYSIHLDETNPQLQLLFTPVTQDGRLSQKDFFKGPGDLQRQHKAHRQALADAGYDVEFKVTARSKEHLSSAEYAAKADAVAERAERVAQDHDALNDWDAQLLATRHELEELAAALEEREGILDRREAEIPSLRRRAVNEGKEMGHAEGRAELQARADQILKTYSEQLRARPISDLFAELLRTKDKSGRPMQLFFDRLVNQRLQQFEVEHGVVDDLELEDGDLEQFIADTCSETTAACQSNTAAAPSNGSSCCTRSL